MHPHPMRRHASPRAHAGTRRATCTHGQQPAVGRCGHGERRACTGGMPVGCAARTHMLQAHMHHCANTGTHTQSTAQLRSSWCANTLVRTCYMHPRIRVHTRPRTAPGTDTQTRPAACTTGTHTPGAYACTSVHRSSTPSPSHTAPWAPPAPCNAREHTHAHETQAHAGTDHTPVAPAHTRPRRHREPWARTRCMPRTRAAHTGTARSFACLHGSLSAHTREQPESAAVVGAAWVPWAACGPALPPPLCSEPS